MADANQFVGYNPWGFSKVGQAGPGKIQPGVPPPLIQPGGQNLPLGMPMPAPGGSPGMMGGGGQQQYDPAANYNTPAPPTAPNSLPGTSLNVNPGGVNPYLNDPLSSLYHGRPNPMYQQQDDFYGDLQKFFAPSANP